MWEAAPAVKPRNATPRGLAKKNHQAGEIRRQSLNKQHHLKAGDTVQHYTDGHIKQMGFVKIACCYSKVYNSERCISVSFYPSDSLAFFQLVLPNHAECFPLPIHPLGIGQGILVFWCFLFANIPFGLLIERLGLWKALIFERVVRLQFCKLQSTNTSIFMLLLSTLRKLDSGIPAWSKPSASLHFFKWVGGGNLWAFSLISCC